MNKRQSFGGKWTEDKLTILQKYLQAYVSLMRNNERAKHFKLTYLDGFAGSGRNYIADENASTGLFEDFNDSETEAFYRGSPCRALEIDPPFDSYVFVETRDSHVAELQSLVDEFPDRAASVKIVKQDANLAVPEWCQALSKNDRALVFLDPYGMQVNWKTVEALAKSEKVDLWVLVPLGQAIIRLLTSKQPPDSWGKALTRFFGTDDWKDHFYITKQSENLFGAEEVGIRNVDFDRITKYVVSRLGSVFTAVLDEPVFLRNKTGTPIYLLCFAASNPKGASTAVKIAKDIARKLKNG